MKKILRHIFSLMTVSVFLLLALSSQIDRSKIECGDGMNIAAEPLGGDVAQLTSVRIRVVDKETNEPLPFVTVNTNFLLNFFAHPDEKDENGDWLCPFEGIMDIQIADIGTYITDVNGIVEILQFWVAADVKDSLIGIVGVEGGDEYVSRETNIRIKQDSPTATFTISLLKLDSL